jgi:hypothetical protein
VLGQAGDVLVHCVGDVVSAALSSESTDDEIALRTMSCPIDAGAVWPVAAFVDFRQRTAQKLLDWRQTAHQAAAAFDACTTVKA